ncbi:NADPH-dependent F420 reductase [Streptomyces sp. NPDC059371]|uniref:NADPH-dependent F420 reductase n=1 Tax=Streptomyces sp. NPDC059371 TaxID=3346812 RepID=UPI00369BD11D
MSGDRGDAYGVSGDRGDAYDMSGDRGDAYGVSRDRGDAYGVSGDRGDAYGVSGYGGRGSTVMTIGVLGTGGIAVTLATMFARAGHEVRLGPGAPGPLAVADPGEARGATGLGGGGGALVSGEGRAIVSGGSEATVTSAGGAVVSGGSCEEVVARSSVIVPAFLGVQGAVQQLRPWRAGLRGKILVDITNPFTGGHIDFVGPWAVGGTEDLAAAFPEARLVGAFKNVWWEAFDGCPDPTAPDIHVISDDTEAKRTFLRLCAATPFTYVDAGGLHQARRVERMVLSGVSSTGVSAA